MNVILRDVIPTFSVVHISLVGRALHPKEPQTKIKIKNAAPPTLFFFSTPTAQMIGEPMMCCGTFAQI